MENESQIEQVNSEREGHVGNQYLRKIAKSNRCSCLIATVFVSLLLLIISILFLSTQQMQRINEVYGPILQHMPFFSGELHYSRIPWQYWQHRIQMVKAMGFNAVSIYIMWNYHQIQKGKFDFQSPQKNLTRFLELTAKHNMKVLLRPGPYVCAEWDFGGLPARLLASDTIDIRTHNPEYQAEVKIYFQKLAEIIRPFMLSNKGNIVLLQIENQLGSLNEDITHTLNLKQMWKDLRIQSEFYHQDASWHWKKHYWPGAHVGLSQGATLMDFAVVDISTKREDTSLVFGGQIYTGWLTHWGEKMNGRETLDFADHLERLLKANRSLSLYVAHGGTNFGLTAGANGFPNNDYMSHITSYDYDAPINEHGAATSKYHLIRLLMQKYQKVKLPPIPLQIKTISLQAFKPSTIQAYLFANIKQPILTQSALTFFESQDLKMYNQGIVLYQTILPQSRTYFFKIKFRDFAIIYVDETRITTLSRGRAPLATFNVTCQKSKCKLRILVEAMGHINYGIMQKKDRKGIVQFQEVDKQGKQHDNTNYLWDISSIPIDQHLINWQEKSTKISSPLLISSQFEVTSPGDTYFDLSNYGKGYVWINGNLLGRYWQAGPQKRLYCPGVWLKLGNNTIHILQLLKDEIGSISGHKNALD